MKSVLISIKPKWCELIANGKKTIEVRKTKPKFETPFKCYIYCTKGDKLWIVNEKEHSFSAGKIAFFVNAKQVGGCCVSNGKVIGEFVCDGIIPMSVTYSDPNNRIAQKEFPYTCLTDKQIIDYLGNGKQGYGWHISNLVIYDNPKKLGEFRHCGVKLGAKVTRPPQSWYYVDMEESV